MSDNSTPTTNEDVDNRQSQSHQITSTKEQTELEEKLSMDCEKMANIFLRKAQNRTLQNDESAVAEMTQNILRLCRAEKEEPNETSEVQNNDGPKRNAVHKIRVRIRGRVSHKKCDKQEEGNPFDADEDVTESTECCTEVTEVYETQPFGKNITDQSRKKTWNDEKIKTLLFLGDTYLEMLDGDGLTPLLWASSGFQHALVKRLLELGAKTEVRNKDGETPLCCASRIGCLPTVELLLDKGSIMESKDKNGFTPLMLACHYNHEDVVQFLLERRANEHGNTFDDNTAFSSLTSPFGY